MRIFLLTVFLVASLSNNAQEKSTARFGDVTAKDFERKLYSVDSNANAVVIADIGSSVIEGNTKGWFSLIYKRYRRVHILNKNGFDAAEFRLQLYSDGEDEEKLDRLKAVTYNLENGKVAETKLDQKSGLFKENLSRNHSARKFTWPNVKEGSIIELEYTIVSDFLFNLRSWEFQGGYPRLWSEYNVSIPGFLAYVFLTQGSQKYDIRDRKSKVDIFSVTDVRSSYKSDNVSFEAPVNQLRWVMKDVPALKEESFTSTLENHISKIDFQLSEYLQPLTYRKVMGTWPGLSKTLMEAEYFGRSIGQESGFVREEINSILKSSVSRLEKAQKIYAYVRDNYTCTGAGLYIDQTLRNVVKTRKGNVAEINLLLTAMLRQAEIEADPVLLSTRTNGFVYSVYPILDKFNYVIARVNIDNKPLLLDASEPRLGFGWLPLRCYNGHARVMNTDASPLELNSDLVTEAKTSTMFVVNGQKGVISGSMQQQPGYYESLRLRDRIKEKGIENLQKDIQKAFGSDISIYNFAIDSLDLYDQPMGIRYEFNLNEAKEGIIYMNPMFGEGYKENPFKSANRLYPVEMPHAVDETFNLQLEVPEGYILDEIPQSLVIKLNEKGEGLFEYRISHSGGIISFRSRLKLTRTNFTPDEYESLREFFNLVVKKHSEQVVFKKKARP